MPVDFDDFAPGPVPLGELNIKLNSLKDASNTLEDTVAGIEAGSGVTSFDDLEDIPTTLAGYGITDASSDAELAAEAATRAAANSTLTTAVTAAQSDVDAHEAETAPHSAHMDVDGSKAFTGDVDMGGNLLTNLADGVAPTDAATVGQLGVAAAGFAPRLGVRVTTLAALPANTRSTNTLTANSNGNINTAGIDGITDIAVGNRILVKNESTGANNGVYEVTAIGGAGAPWVLDRATDFNSSGEATLGAYYPVAEGSPDQIGAWYLTTDSVTLNTTALVFQKDTRSGGVTNTASNGNSEGEGVYDSTAGVNFVFRGIASTTDRLTVAYNAATKAIRLTVVEANILINNLSGVLGYAKGGTGQSSWALGEILYASATNVLSKLAPNLSTTEKSLKMKSGVPYWGPGVDYASTSASSVTIPTSVTGTKAFNIASVNKSYTIGQLVRASSDADASNYIDGTVLSYSSVTLNLTVTGFGGSGVHSDWSLNLVGPQGPAGAAGTDANQAANLVKAGPTSGGSAAPGYRSLVTADFPADGVTYAKIQNVSATDKLLGRSTAGAGDVEEIACTAAGRALIDDTDAAAQRTTLGLVINTDVQAYSAKTAAIAALTWAADKVAYFTGAGAAAVADLTSYGRSIIGAADAGAVRTLLGLGTAATKNTGTTTGTVAAGDDSRLSDARTPTAHKSTHATGGSDALAASDIGAASASHTHAASDIASGQVALARGGTNADLSATGGTGQFVKQSTSGGALSVGAIAASELPTANRTRTLSFVIDGGGSAITTGVKGDVVIDFACTIQGVTLLADQSGSIVVDIWKDTYANYPPTVADTITASAKPTISSATKAQDTTLTGWTTSVSAGDTIRFNVDSITTCQRVTVALKVLV